ncbi:hypothetical protein GDO81_002948 [Engystomops pustulosus]|uniref:Uncharacterized protein n=1 Tax=Engystomops pustulosus TaxID=76066 RepID=A0AAV7DRV6_ENGPU|nr:hypothetical protein GDO81_002948 [Engystomops pustulosus]
MWTTCCRRVSVTLERHNIFANTDSKLLEEATISICKSLIENNPRTGNLSALIRVFLSRTKELKISAECQK